MVFTRGWGMRPGLVAILLLLASLFSGACERRPEPLGPPEVEVALRGIDRNAPVRITLYTDRGEIPCELDAARAPRAVALFVGLATGRATWRDQRIGELSRRPLYRDLEFHRVIPGVMIQSGCVLGDSSGFPGYRIEVESSPEDAARLRRPGALALARYTVPPFRSDPNPPPAGHVMGSQFAVTLTDMSHLAGKVTVLGHCAGLDVVRAIAQAGSQPGKRSHLGRVSVRGIAP